MNRVELFIRYLSKIPSKGFVVYGLTGSKLNLMREKSDHRSKRA